MKKLMVAVMLMFSSLFVFMPVMAADTFNAACDDPNVDADAKKLAGCDTRTDGEYGKIAQNLINLAISIIGIVAVIVIVMAGQRYIVSNGDPGKTKQAKDMLMWGLIGLVITVLSVVIVNFVIASLQ
ncbi:hypothetical protein IJG73_00770 [Candidatus Saccharibacteria bacterium]|nr:hypothetical protein [Candidatus Saccharibacteria bacterium]